MIGWWFVVVFDCRSLMAVAFVFGRFCTTACFMSLYLTFVGSVSGCFCADSEVVMFC